MKVAMVTPMAPASAIADVMLQAVPALAAHWDLEIWCPREPELRTAPVPVRVFDKPDEGVISELETYDLVVHVLGGSAYHLSILSLARAVPGLLVLHDAFLTDLVVARALKDGQLYELVAYVRAAYGDEAAEMILRYGEAGGSEEWFRTLAEVRLTETVTTNALGAVVHSSWHAEQVDGLLLGEVSVAPLPVPSPALGIGDLSSDRSAELLAALPDEAVLLVTVGAANANRGLDVLLEAVAGSPELAQVHLWAVGGGSAGASAVELADSLGMGDRFALTGRVSDASLTAVLERADLAAALRQPVLEGASASVLTQMLAGRAVVVYDQAHYRDLPDDAVVKVSSQAGSAGLRDALVRMVGDPEERTARGDRARDHVRATRTGEAYAEALVRAGDLALGRRPYLHLAQDVAAHLERLDLHGEAAVISRATDLAFELFDLS